MKRYYDAWRKRLVYIGEYADPEMWNRRWKNEIIEKLFFPPRLTRTHKTIVNTTKTYLSRGARILEGGCGLGDKVFLLKQSGYDVVGVDYAVEAIEISHKFMPDLKVQWANLQNLPFANGFFDGYWSFGVIEHFYEGYEKIACEMYRVLKHEGFLFMTVPAMSAFRKLKAGLGLYPRFSEVNVNTLNFYQFAFAAEEIKESFDGFGFEFIERKSWNVYKGLSDEIPGARAIMSILCRFFDGPTFALLSNFCHHMNLFVFQKRSFS